MATALLRRVASAVGPLLQLGGRPLSALAQGPPRAGPATKKKKKEKKEKYLIHPLPAPAEPYHTEEEIISTNAVFPKYNL